MNGTTSPSRRRFDGSDDRYCTLLRASTTIVWDMAATGVFHRHQPDWAIFTGQSFEQYREDGWLNAVHPEDRVRVADEWSQSINRGAQFEMRYRLRSATGEFRYMHVRVMPIRDDDGSVREWVGAHADVSEQVTMEQSLRATLGRLETANRELLQAGRAKSSFLATMSHELRTPLNALIGYSELLLLGIPQQMPDAIRPHIERIDLSARHLLQLIEEVLTFSRIEAGSERVHYEIVHLPAVMREVNAVMQPMAIAKGLRFIIDVPSDPIELVTDPRKIRQILLNLLGNATKFTDRGTITLRSHVRAGTLVLEISDTGIGIAPQYHAKIFEPFWQVDNRKTRAVGGTGLGLAVTRELAMLMNGTVIVESTPGVGTTLTVTLPLNGRSAERVSR